MRQLSIEKEMNRPAAQIWKWISDFGNIHKIHPALKHSYVIGEQSCGIGAVRVCEMRGTGYMKEKVVSWKENEEYTIELVETSMPMKRATATIGVRALDAARSEAYMRLSYEMKFGLIGRVLDFIMVRFVMRKMGADILSKLEDETRV